MGPRPFGRGNLLMELEESYQHMLQWGHDLSAVETPHKATKIQVGLPLQWGHDLSAVETGP